MNGPCSEIPLGRGCITRAQRQLGSATAGRCHRVTAPAAACRCHNTRDTAQGSWQGFSCASTGSHSCSLVTAMGNELPMESR